MHLRVTEELRRHFRDNNIVFTLNGNDRLQVGETVTCADTVCIEPHSAILTGGSLPSIGSYSFTSSALPDGTQMGRYCSLSWGIQVIAGNHPIEFLTTSSATYDRAFAIFSHIPRAADGRIANRRIRGNRHDAPVIESDVWIGQFATLARGVTLGTGCVVGANAVVTKSVPPYAIVGGNPARVIRMRFSERLVERLLASRWWEYDFVDLCRYQFEYPEVFLDQFEDAKIRDEIKPFSPATTTFEDLKRLCGMA